jgi:hypothetical protein
VEYDGRYFHKDKEDIDLKKTESLEKIGWRVIRVRESPLTPLSRFDIQVPINATPKVIANHLLDQIAKRLHIQIPGLEDYKKRHTPINAKAADAYIESLLLKQIYDDQLRLNLPPG